MPALALFTFCMRAAAACFRPLRSSVPVTTMTMMKMGMLRLLTKLLPRVSRNSIGLSPPARAVATAATMMTRMESSFRAKPTTKMTMPMSVMYSMPSPSFRARPTAPAPRVAVLSARNAIYDT